ncbi:MAG: D-2-hydroxyacid dehydrogenase family protein [Pseudomonadales bacterium]|nr:D-2-hydroxyacid dehydrogenase family protein [Pseudomonadales bacterium]NRA14586.1 D-2-hydroxyacid dehydrogenase family protein [Oceanospirillaceae bacterium]
MKIAVLDDYQDVVKDLDCFKILAGHDIKVLNQTYPEAVLVEKLSEVEVLVLIRERTQISESLVSKLANLKLISQTGKVSNHIDPLMCKKYGVDVLEGVGSPVAPAELCWALIMSASRNIPAYAENLRENKWQQSGSLGLGRTLQGLTLGIWGYGKIGQRIAQYAKVFGMKVMIWGSAASCAKANRDGFYSAENKADFFSQSDVVTLHLRLNDVTKGCVTQSDLRAMKVDSLFVNTSRAELVETGALYLELSQQQTKSAAIDVYEVEPATAATDPLISLANVLALPHLGYVERNSYELYFKVAFENVVAYAREAQKT